MTFATDVDAALLQAAQAPGQRDLLDSAFTTLESSLNTVLVTNIGKAATGAEYVAVQEKILELARYCATMVDDYES